MPDMGVGEMIGLGIAGAGTVGGLVGGSQSSGYAGRAADAQTRIAEEQAALAREQWNRYLNAFAPLEDRMIAEAQTPARESPGFLSMAGGINRRYGDSAGNIRRMMGGAYPGGAGVSFGAQRANELNRTRDLTKAEASWNDNRWNRMLGIAGLGRSLPATATAGYASAGNQYGSLANMYGNLAGQAYGGVGQGLGNLYQWYALSNRSNPGQGSYYSGYGYDPSWETARITY